MKRLRRVSRTGDIEDQEANKVSKPELGTKRVCPETGRKFYDLNRDPITSPYTGQTYPLSYFEGGETEPETEEADVQAENTEAEKESADVEIVSLEDADEETSDTGETIPDIDSDDDDVDIGDDDDDTFLETDDDEDDDVSGIIAVSDDEEES